MVSSLGSHLEQWQESYAVEIVFNVYIKTKSISVFSQISFQCKLNIGLPIALELISVCGINVEFCFFKCRSLLIFNLEGFLKHKNSQIQETVCSFDVSFENK